MAYYWTIENTLGGWWRSNSAGDPRDPYKWSDWITYWEYEFTSGAGYFDFDSNNGLDPYTPLVITSAPATLVIRPTSPLHYKGYHSQYGYSEAGCRCIDLDGIESYLYVRNNDNTKWVKVEGDYTNEQTILTCSNAANNRTDSWTGSPQSSGSFFFGRYRINGPTNQDGYSLSEYWYYENYAHHTSVYGSLPSVFTVGVDDFIFEFYYIIDSTGIKNIDCIDFSFSGNYWYERNNGDDLKWNYGNPGPGGFELETDVGDWGNLDGTINNDNLLPLLIYDNDNSQQTDWENDWELSTNAYFSWNADYFSLYNPDDNVWALRLPWPVALNDAFEFYVRRAYRASIIFMNEDASKWFRVGIDVLGDWEVKDSEGLYDDWENFSISTVEVFASLTASYSLEVTMRDVNDQDPSVTHTYNLKAIFGNEYIYFGYYPTGSPTSYCRFYDQTILQSYNVARQAQFGQTPGNVIYEPLKFFSSQFDELADYEYYLYFKDKIRNSQNYSDLDSLYAMNPSYASDAFNSLKPGEFCIVVDRWHRTYFYQVKSGYHADDLPDFIWITDSLYWELVEVIQNDEMVVEQHDIVGLVDTNDVLITHTAHNRNKSYAPNIQLLHNNKVKTSDIVVSVVSNTQLRLATDQTTAFENLKANVFVTV